MLTLNVKCAVYAALKDWGACAVALLVFDDDYTPSWDDAEYIAMYLRDDEQYQLAMMMWEYVPLESRRNLLANLIRGIVWSHEDDGVGQRLLARRFNNLWYDWNLGAKAKLLPF